MAKKREICEYSIDPAAAADAHPGGRVGDRHRLYPRGCHAALQYRRGGDVLQAVRHGPLPPDQETATWRLRRDHRHHPGAQPDPRHRRRFGRPLRSRARYGLHAQGGRQRRSRRLRDPRCRQAAHGGRLLRHPDRRPLARRNRQRPGRSVYRPVWTAARRGRPGHAAPPKSARNSGASWA